MARKALMQSESTQFQYIPNRLRFSKAKSFKKSFQATVK